MTATIKNRLPWDARFGTDQSVIRICADDEGAVEAGTTLSAHPVTIRVALLGDQRLFREALRALLGTHPDFSVVAEAGEVRELSATTDASDPDVVVLEYQLRSSSGPSLVRELLARNANRRILVLGTHTEEEKISQAFAAGALGWACTEQTSTEVFDAIRTVAGGNPYLAPELGRFVSDDHVQIKWDRKLKPSPLSALTRREREVFELVIRGMQNHAIADALTISQRTVETHRSRILHKLHVHTIVDLMQFAARHGMLGP